MTLGIDPTCATDLGEPPSVAVLPPVDASAANRDSAWHEDPSCSCSYTVIEPRRGWRALQLGDLWHYRGLIWLLAAREIKTRYRQSMLGALWTLLQPLMTLAIFTVLFTLLGGTPTQAGVPYVVSALATLLLWTFFTSVLTQAANSIQNNGGLIAKIYCPRLVFPIYTILTGLVDLAVGLVLLAGLMIYHRVVPGWTILTLPVFVVLAAAVALAVGLWVSALSIRLRDLRFMLPSILQMWFFASPVIYDVGTLIPGRLRAFYVLNPMVGILEGFRWSLLGTGGFSWSMLAISVPMTTALLLGGLYCFRRMELTIADHL